MTHTIIYLGNYDLNFDRLRAHAGPVSRFLMLRQKGQPCPPAAPSDKVDGIVFGYLEKGDERLAAGKDACYVVTVGDVILANPLRLIPDRHTDGKWFGPAASQFGDSSARALLEDIIRQN